MKRNPKSLKKRECRLGDLVNLKRGYDLPVHMRQEGKSPVVSSSGITGTHNEAKVKCPGVVTGRYGTLGEVFYLNKDFWPLNTSLYVQDFKNNNPRFIYYYLKTVLSASFNAAGAVPGVNRNTLHKLAVPTLPREQQKIAAILSAYDDLIDNNKRRIALLEKLAEKIYREWFVRMRFPGHEKVKFEKGIPKEWKICKISEFSSFKYGFTESAINDERLPKFLRVTDINKHSYINWQDVPNCQIDGTEFEKYRLKNKDIVIARMADPGKVAIVEESIEAVFASYLIKIVFDSTKVTPYYLFFTLKSDYYLGYFSGANSGATRGSINAGVIGGTGFISPDYGLMELFDSTVSPLRKKIRALCNINANLGTSKNLLLGRLISGKLSVDNLCIEFPPSMQDEQDVPHA